MQHNNQDSRPLAIVVPGCTDLNRGDQALVWEAADLIRDMRLAEDIYLLDSGEGEQEREAQIGQTRGRGFQLLRALLPHPRRGRHKAHDKIRETGRSLLRMMLHSLYDYLRGQVVLCLAPFPTLLDRFLTPEQRKTMRAFREAKVLVVKGGGFLHAYGSLQDPYYTWYALFYLRLANRLRKPVVILPNSFGPFLGLGVRRQIRQVLSRCVFIAARESISAQMLGETLGRAIPVYPDMGYFLESSERAVGEGVCRRAGIPLGEKPCVAFTLRPYRFPESTDPGAAFDRYLDAMAELVRHVVDLGMYPVLATHVSGPSAHENDRLAIEELRTRLTGVLHSWIDIPGDCRTMKAVYGCMDYLIGTRFHSVVFAQAAGVPCLAVAYGGNKATGIMRDMGLGDYVIPIGEMTGGELCARFDHLRANEPAVKQHMRVWRYRLPDTLSNMSDEIAHCLGLPGEAHVILPTPRATELERDIQAQEVA